MAVAMLVFFDSAKYWHVVDHDIRILTIFMGPAASASKKILQYHQGNVNHGKKNRHGSHAHMPSERDIIEPLQHENSQGCRCYQREKRENSQPDDKGKAKDHDVRNGGHDLSLHQDRAFHRRVNRAGIGIGSWLHEGEGIGRTPGERIGSERY